MKNELTKLYKEYCEFIDDNCDRSDIGYTRKNLVKANLAHFMNWLENGDNAYFSSNY